MDFIHKNLFAKINGGTKYQKQLIIDYYKELYKIPLCHDGLNAFLSQVKLDNVIVELAITKQAIRVRGCCLTQEKVVYHSFLRRFVKHLHFTIALRKIDVGTLMHEITHALERISGMDISADFAFAINKDLEHKEKASINLKRAIEKILFHDLTAYPKNQHNSELLARFYQMLAMSREVGQYDDEFHFQLNDVLSFFKNTVGYIDESFNQVLKTKIIDEVKENTKKIDFSEEVNSFKSKLHADHSVGKKWNKKIKSNFD